MREGNLLRLRWEQPLTPRTHSYIHDGSLPMVNCEELAALRFHSSQFHTLPPPPSAGGRTKQAANSILTLLLAPPCRRTKHYQTHYMTAQLMLCDCPGLVFPREGVALPMQVGGTGRGRGS